MTRSGANLALLLLGSYRSLVDTVVAELAGRGFPDVRPVHDFALRAIGSGADNAAELGRRLSVSKQAAAKTVDILRQRGYVTVGSDPTDARRRRIEVTARGYELMREGESIFDDLRSAWRDRFGAEALSVLESQLATIVGDAPIRVDNPGWIAADS
ncbi:MarR family transcriptional regulator [Mycolicibacterium fortuitum]|nr:MarR family transcriptional regulator [Mycolicibacterium fortuitum]